MVIQVLFKDLRSGGERKYEFDQSPVRIGRNPLNNIVLEGNFVSGWHGIIRFDKTGTFYFDLGSTNGTCIGGKRLPKNTPVPLDASTRLTIWMFELVVTPGVANAASQPHPVPAPAPFTSGGPGRTTEVFQVGSPAQTPHTPTSPSRIVSVGARPTPPPPTNRRTSPAPATGMARPTTDQNQERLNRCLRIIRAFADAFMGLKKGYEQFGSEVGVRPLSGSTPLHRARTSNEVLDFVLDPAVDPEACARDLNAVFADMGIHDVALMEGISQSVRGLLAKLDPNSLDLGLWGKAKTRWSAYVDTFNSLLAEEAALHAEIFGDEFAAAYASVASGHDEAQNDDE